MAVRRSSIAASYRARIVLETWVCMMTGSGSEPDQYRSFLCPVDVHAHSKQSRKLASKPSYDVVGVPKIRKPSPSLFADLRLGINHRWSVIVATPCHNYYN
ncbi:hypothetical protein FRC03_010389 [Tulasnella sp. 419]|nr:hypothetical protein FRC03_010389 [Tulasnella sp. 419]